LWGLPPSGHGFGHYPAVVCGRLYPERCARRRDPEPRSHLLHRREPHFALSSGAPKSAATFFCSSTSASARSARCFHRTISRSCSAIFLSRGSGGVAFGPRGLAASPASSPRSRAARQVVRSKQYHPSRRSSAPSSPGFVQRSASRTIRRLYSAVNHRRCALAATSVSPATGAALGKTPVALRAPSVSPSRSIPSPRFSTTPIHRCLPALYSKLSPPRCLTPVGTEGWVKAMAQKGSQFRAEANPALRTVCS